MKILVTGGVGFIGSNFIRHIQTLRQGYAIVNFDRPTYAGNLATHFFSPAELKAFSQRVCQRRPAWLQAVIGGRPVIAKGIVPITTKDYPTPSRRPAKSLLANARLKRTFGVKLPDWRIQLKTAPALEECH